MYLFNPLYVISNVIFIEPERSYILIEKKCWNSLIGRIFKGKRPSSKEIWTLKSISYGLYVIYISTGNVESEKFNFQIAKLQGVEEYVHKVDLKVEGFLSEQVDIKFEEEGFFSESEILPDKVEIIDPHPLIKNIEEDKILNQTQVQSKRNEEMEEEIRSLLNLNMNLSLSQAKIISSIGYGRILSLFRNLSSSGTIRFSNDLEKYFFLSNETIIYSYLNISQKNHSVNICPQFFLYYCDECNMVNDHFNLHVNIKADPHTQERIDSHSKSVSAWNKFGRLSNDWFFEIGYKNYVFNYNSRIPELSCYKIFHNSSDFNYINVAQNIIKMEGYYDNFLEARKYLLTQPENQRKFLEMSTDLEIKARDLLETLYLDSESYLSKDKYEFDMFKYFSDGNYKEFLKSKEVSQQALSLVSENVVENRSFKPFGFS